MQTDRRTDSERTSERGVTVRSVVRIPENGHSQEQAPGMAAENAASEIVRLWWRWTGVTGGRGPERRQQVVEQRNRGARVDGGAAPEGLLPPGLESRGHFLAHLLQHLQRSTVDSSTPRSAAACLFVPPSAQRSTIFARSARYWAVFARRAHRISWAR
jgi:hypothetical protein